MEISQSALLLHYKRKDIQEAIIKNAQDREVAIKFGEGGFGRRPDTLKYPNDVIELVKQGATSFHISEEHWSNVLQINPELRRAELDKLRAGWDLVLDIDCEFLEYSKIAAHLIVEAFKYFGIKSFSVKFSGNHGFHLAVPFRAFPDQVQGKSTKDLFPEGPRRIAFFLKDFIREHLAKEILKIDDINKIMKKTDKKFSELIKDNIFDPYSVLDIDTVLISSRHLYRSVYSFNEKSGLVSIPIKPEEILGFNKEFAAPGKFKMSGGFLEHVIEGEARQLIVEAFDYIPKEDAPKNEDYKEFAAVENAILKEFFPPCINMILNGLEDGKKRSMFILINFLTSCGWKYEDIDKLLHEWNKKNKEALREVLLVGQLRYHSNNKKRILPPNCQNVLYYTDLRVCNPDNLCRKIKNPVNYAIRKSRYTSNNSKKKENPAKPKIINKL